MTKEAKAYIGIKVASVTNGVSKTGYLPKEEWNQIYFFHFVQNQFKINQRPQCKTKILKPLEENRGHSSRHCGRQNFLNRTPTEQETAQESTNGITLK